MEAPSSSSIPARVARSKYELAIELVRAIDEVDKRIVSASELHELIVDIVRSDAALDALPESERDDAPIPASCLCAPQWISGMDVQLKRISYSLSRTSRAEGRTTGALLSMLRTRAKIWGIARKASSSCSNDAFSKLFIQVSTLSRFAWKEESMREFLPPVLIFDLVDLCLTKS